MSITTSIVFKDEKERDYIKRLIAVRRNLQGLVENGALDELPDMIQLAMSASAKPKANAARPAPVSTGIQNNNAADTTPGFGISVNDFLSGIKQPPVQAPEEPDVFAEVAADSAISSKWLNHILNTGEFPAVEENTREQNEMLEDKSFQNLYKIYRKTRDPEVLTAIVALADKYGIND